ncbi:MAG: tyrosine--tRNA ligase [Lachnospiraceae bacterium]|nr:tyrosine--tRNA ligase [Lachnospiraceae bacterium]MBR6348924.1 tyrosine--tRNA ligase [Lachnospiraceae bacterium]
MSRNVYDVLEERGFIAQCTHPEELRELLGKEKVKFYIGFDATADSLTVGHFLTIMAMKHMQEAGHVPVALMGGGTTMVGDPTGKSDMRQMLTKETIDYNISRFKEQISKYLDTTEGKMIFENNADWLLDLNYVELLREVGIHFSVNRMLAAECYKQRMERGLTFFEFNYMIMQSYDFWKLHEKDGVVLEMGGDDQWSNIIGGVELIRKKEQKPAYGLTFTLLTTSDGVKMGKTVKGALWLDPAKTTPYEFYQYWRNIEDVKVEQCLGLLTFLPMDEVRRLGSLKDAEINKAKEVLAFEVTKIIHGEEEAIKAQNAAREVFGGSGISQDMPTHEYTRDEFAGADVIQALVDTGLAPTRSEGRRLIEGGGVLVNNDKVTDVKRTLMDSDLTDGTLVLKKGKKKSVKIVVK